MLYIIFKLKKMYLPFKYVHQSSTNNKLKDIEDQGSLLSCVHNERKEGVTFLYHYEHKTKVNRGFQLYLRGCSGGKKENKHFRSTFQ